MSNLDEMLRQRFDQQIEPVALDADQVLERASHRRTRRDLLRIAGGGGAALGLGALGVALVRQPMSTPIAPADRPSGGPGVSESPFPSDVPSGMQSDDPSGGSWERPAPSASASLAIADLPAGNGDLQPDPRPRGEGDGQGVVDLGPEGRCHHPHR